MLLVVQNQTITTSQTIYKISHRAVVDQPLLNWIKWIRKLFRPDARKIKCAFIAESFCT